MPAPDGQPDGDRPRVLAIAEAANPEWFSVPLEGWSHTQALRAVADVHLVTQVRNRDAILRAGLVEGVDFTAIDSEAVARKVNRAAGLLRGGANRGWTTVTALSALTYPYFEMLVWQQFGDQLRAGRYDLVHRVIPLTPTAPSPLATKLKRVGVPFVLGPLNGGTPWPRGFDHVRRKEREWLSYVRPAFKLMPGYAATRRDASAIIIGSTATWAQTPRRWRHKCVYVPENGIDPQRFGRRRERAAGRPIRGVFVGRLVPYKGADMLLDAAAEHMKAGHFELTVLGDGPERAGLQAQAERLGVGDRVTFTGHVDHTAVQDHLAAADVFTFPSIREFGGAVIIEAMAIGLPAMAVSYGGPAELMTEDTAFPIELGSREQIVARFRGRLAEVIADPSLIEQRSDAARRRVLTHFTWAAKARQVRGVYDWALGRTNKPDYGMPICDAPDHDHVPSALAA